MDMKRFREISANLQREFSGDEDAFILVLLSKDNPTLSTDVENVALVGKVLGLLAENITDARHEVVHTKHN